MIIRNSSTLFTASTESGGQVQANKGLKEKGANCIFSRGNTNSCGETLVREGISEARPAERRNIRFGVASNPEFLREGSAVADSLCPDRIVGGASDGETLDAMRELYRPLTAQSFDPPPGLPRPSSVQATPLFTTSLTSAEMIKYAANAFLAMKIGFANEIANICERVGAGS